MSTCDTRLRARKCPLSAECRCRSASPEFAPPICETHCVSRRDYARRQAGRGARSSSTLRCSSTTTPVRAVEQLRPTSSAFGSALRYAGTPRGLAGFIDDLHTLGIADGVTLLPLRAADNADCIINDVLPILGLDIARLSA